MRQKSHPPYYIRMFILEHAPKSRLDIQVVIPLKAVDTYCDTALT